MSEIKQFKGYAIHSQDKWTDFQLIDFESKTFGESDIEIAIECCGVCGSDVHTITGGWGEMITPMITGHEIAGKAVRVGDKVQSIKVGDRVGVGAQACSCFQCKPCKTDNENYCVKGGVDTYNAKYENGDIAHGGYANGTRVHERFVFPIPDAIASTDACSLLCGGLTVYSPLVRHGCKPGAKVGIVGLGGLGHYAVLLASAIGAEVTVFSHSKSKEADARKMGAKEFVITTEGFQEPYAFHFDLIVSTRDVAQGFDLSSYVSMLDIHGKFVLCGLPDDELPAFKAQAFAANGCFVGGSHIGSKKECLEMLDLVVKKNVKPWIQLYKMKDAGEAVKAVKDNSVRYRAVLEMDIKS